MVSDPHSVFRLLFTSFLARYLREVGERAMSQNAIAQLDDRALFALVKAVKQRAQPRTWNTARWRRR
jgi:hypothetical protein